MAFDLHENATDSKGATPYLLNIQHDLCKQLSTRIVVPVVRARPAQAETDFVVEMNVGDETVYAITTHLAAVPVAVLGAIVADGSIYYDQVRNSVDRLFVGY